MNKFYPQPGRVLLKSPPVRNRILPQRSSESRDRQEYQPSLEGRAQDIQFLSISKQKQREWDDECYRTDVNVMFTQMSAKQGIKQFKERAVDAIIKEYKQVHDMNTFGRVCPE